ncbi:hypothetical protein LTR36_008144 [Oleoguttula mirabilis]|uniref:C2H2-type domain-containing protein n=1 Tax=Oleoguttula mirabilis TaxID=1507867 RepID=A0AAV9J910_9PEZI|nr:hypothetical protein LTR36_008144 [Oleoguttula mirabilis]
MAIPRAQDPIPPPLPPPSYIPGISAGHDPGWQWGNDPGGSDFGRAASVKPGSSLLGGVSQCFRPAEKERDFYMQHAAGDARRGSSISTVTLGRDYDMTDANSDEDGSSSRPASTYRLQSERQLEQRTLVDASNTYDKQLLSRIGGPNTPKRQSVSYPPGAQDIAQLAQREGERRNSQLRPLSMPERRHTSSNSVDSPAGSRWPPSGAVSPGYNGFWAEPGTAESLRAPATRHGSIALDDNASYRGSYDHSMFIHEDPLEDGQMSNLNIHDRSPSSSEDLRLKAGTKRRASSPPRDGAREERSSGTSNLDACGYCGEEFSNPPQWDVRAEHLNQIHKFGECNQAKKFFRADHFRQHLKHSHAGTSGKWTNMLENACMKDEPPPERRTSPATMPASSAQGQTPPTLVLTTTGLPDASSRGHRAIAETPHDR